MGEEKIAVHHVSDTALWVAYYRALESERDDSLFDDRYARMLVGDRGREISESMGDSSRYTRWSVVIRTVVIDELIAELAAGGVDAVVNLGAGMDTRPYRLSGLPAGLKWIEVDYPESVAYKERLLVGQTPRVRLERVALDLCDGPKRREFLASIDAEKALVLTEGVIPYLSEGQVAALAEDLYARPNLRYWVAEYLSPRIYRYFRSPERLRLMKNAPLRFFPADWFGFFARHGWKADEVRYLSAASERLKRPIPMPWWAKVLLRFAPAEKRRQATENAAFVVYAR